MINFSFKKTYLKYIVAFIFIYLIFLLSSLPAKFIFSIAKLPENIKVSSVTGTIWSGKIKQLSISSIKLGSVSWRIHPERLILGQLSSDISLNKKEQFFLANISVSALGRFEIKETKFYIDSTLLQPLIYGMPFSFTGTAEGSFPSITFLENNYIRMNGKISIKDANLISPQQQLFGDFVARFNTEKENETLVIVKSVDSPLILSGKINLTETGAIDVSAKMAARNDEYELDKMLLFFGEKDEQGQVEFKHQLQF